MAGSPKSSTHTAKHARKPLVVDADRVELQFGPEVTAGFKRLEEAVRGKEGFDNDMRVLLQRLASGKAVPLEQALSSLTMLGQETTEYVQATGDKEASSALGDITGHLIGQSRAAKPVTILVEPRARTTGAGL